MKVKDEVDLLVSDVVLHIFYKLETNEETPHFIEQPYESTWTEIWSLNQKNHIIGFVQLLSEGDNTGFSILRPSKKQPKQEIE